MNDLDIPSDSQPTDDFATIPDVPIGSDSQRVSPNQIASGVARGIQQFGSPNIYADSGNNQFVVADTVPQVVMGNQRFFGEGFYVSKPGIDATLNTDPTQWIFNSNQDTFKIVNTGTGTVTVTSSDTANDKRTAIAHGLGYTPIVIGFIQNPSGDIQDPGGETICPYSIYGDTTTGSHPTVLLPLLQYYYVTADTNNIYLNVLSSDVTFYTQLQGTFTFKYYVLQETASS